MAVAKKTAAAAKTRAAAAKTSAAAAKKSVAVASPVKAPRRKRAVAPVVVADAVLVEETSVAANAPELAAAADAPITMDMAGELQPATVAKKGRTMRYLLPANMEIASLGPVHQDLVALEASNDGPFVLDGANLSVIDTAGLQLLISFVSAVQASGKKVSWDNYSVQAYQLANELGVVEQLGD